MKSLKRSALLVVILMLSVSMLFGFLLCVERHARRHFFRRFAVKRRTDIKPRTDIKRRTSIKRRTGIKRRTDSKRRTGIQ